MCTIGTRFAILQRRAPSDRYDLLGASHVPGEKNCILEEQEASEGENVERRKSCQHGKQEASIVTYVP